ncbi:MAG: DUF2505 domain-containing protein [Candidatus Phosphoribacter sp.]|nr:DUF2505 domain-containing protein [Actinomycetales bacterium]
MRITETLVYPAPADVVFAMMTDEQFHAEVCLATHAMSHTVSVTFTAGGPEAGATVVTHRLMPTGGFPEFVRSMVGQSIDIAQTIVYGPPSADRGRVGQASISIGSAPIGFRGTITIMAVDEDDTEVLVEGDLKATLPFVGGKIESAAAPSVITGITREYGVGLKWLQARA